MLALQGLPGDLAGTFRAAALLFITDPEARPADGRAALRAAFNLSPIEATLAQALRDGQSVRQFADAHRMPYETARSHLRRIFMKTGARRQSDLVRMAHGLR